MDKEVSDTGEKSEKIKVENKAICPRCGTYNREGAIYCAKCGFGPISADDKAALTKNIAEVRPAPEHVSIRAGGVTVSPAEKADKQPPSRICGNCGTEVRSKFLEQCPVCYAMLPPLPPEFKSMLAAKLKKPSERTRTRDEKEKNLPKPDRWNTPEMVNVIITSVLVIIAVFYMYIMYIGITYSDLVKENGGNIPINSFTLIVSMGIQCVLGLYPLFYIKNNGFLMRKVGFRPVKSSRYYAIAVIAGVTAAFGVYAAVSLYKISVGLPQQIVEELNVIDNMTIPELVLFVLFYILSLWSETILFKGVLQNGIGDYYRARIAGDSENWEDIRVPAAMRIKTSLLSSVFQLLLYFVMTLDPFVIILNIIPVVITAFIYEYTGRSVWIIFLIKSVYVLIGMYLGVIL